MNDHRLTRDYGATLGKYVSDHAVKSVITPTSAWAFAGLAELGRTSVSNWSKEPRRLPTAEWLATRIADAQMAGVPDWLTQQLPRELEAAYRQTHTEARLPQDKHVPLIIRMLDGHPTIDGFESVVTTFSNCGEAQELEPKSSFQLYRRPIRAGTSWAGPLRQPTFERARTVADARIRRMYALQRVALPPSNAVANILGRAVYETSLDSAAGVSPHAMYAVVRFGGDIEFGITAAPTLSRQPPSISKLVGPWFVHEGGLFQAGGGRANWQPVTKTTLQC